MSPFATSFVVSSGLDGFPYGCMAVLGAADPADASGGWPTALLEAGRESGRACLVRIRVALWAESPCFLLTAMSLFRAIV